MIHVLTIPVQGGLEVKGYDRKDELDWLQTAVGGYIEVVTASESVTFIVNEEGKLKGLPINKRATELWWSLNPAARGADVLVGTVLVAGGTGDDGETQSVHPAILGLLT